MNVKLIVSGFDHAALLVRDLDRSKRWYSNYFAFNALGPNSAPSNPYIGNATTKLAFQEANEERTYVTPVNQGTRASHIAFGTDAEIGFELLVHSDCQSLYFSDSDRYLLEVTTYEVDRLR